MLRSKLEKLITEFAIKHDLHGEFVQQTEGLLYARFVVEEDEEDLLDQIFNLAGFPVETMTYKTNNVTVSYPRYGEDSNAKK